MTLNQVTIPCTDYGPSVSFYRALGLVQIVDSPPRYARFESPQGDGATLSLHCVESRRDTGVVVYFDHSSAAALDRHVDELKGLGFEFLSDPQDQRWGWREARLTDPDGNEVCLMFAGRNRRFPDWRLDDR